MPWGLGRDHKRPDKIIPGGRVTWREAGDTGSLHWELATQLGRGVVVRGQGGSSGQRTERKHCGQRTLTMMKQWSEDREEAVVRGQGGGSLVT